MKAYGLSCTPRVGAFSALSVVFTGAVLATASWVVTRSDDPDAEFGLAIGTMLLISPVVWQTYFIVAIWPLWVLGRRLHKRNWPARPTNIYLAIPLLLAVPSSLVFTLAMLIGRVQLTTGLWLPGAPLVPLLTLSVVPVALFHLLVTELGSYPGLQAARSWRMRLGIPLRVLGFEPGRISPGPRRGPDPLAPAGGGAGAS